LSQIDRISRYNQVNYSDTKRQPIYVAKIADGPAANKETIQLQKGRVISYKKTTIQLQIYRVSSYNETKHPAYIRQNLLLPKDRHTAINSRPGILLLADRLPSCKQTDHQAASRRKSMQLPSDIGCPSKLVSIRNNRNWNQN
jgi:hypothetical protein